jgi:hypothetical protein
VSAAGSNIGTIRLLSHNAVIPAKAKHEFCHAQLWQSSVGIHIYCVFQSRALNADDK